VRITWEISPFFSDFSEGLPEIDSILHGLAYFASGFANISLTVMLTFRGKKAGNYTELRLELSLLKTLPMIGPRIMRDAITTMATKTRINAYSTKPWPFSLGENNMVCYLLSLGISRPPHGVSYLHIVQEKELFFNTLTSLMLKSFAKYRKPLIGQLFFSFV
jgi:hypothetical protein